MADEPLVHRVRQQQNLDAPLSEHLEVRARAGRGEAVRGQIVDRLLALVHPLDIGREGHRRLSVLAGGRMEPEEGRNRVPVRGVLDHPFLEHLAELAPELRVLLRITLGELVEGPEDPLHGPGPDRLHLPVRLENLPRDVQRKVARVDHPAHEAQVRREQVPGILQDEHPPHVEPEATAHVAVPEIERSPPGHEQEHGVLDVSLDPRVDDVERGLEVVRDVLVELLVLLLRDLLPGPAPEGGGPVHRLLLGSARLLPGVFAVPVGAVVPRLAFLRHPDREGDVVRVLAHDPAEPKAVEKVVLALAEVQGHLRAARRHLHRLDGEFAAPVRLPSHPFARRRPGPAGGEDDPLGHDEDGVEADSELPDELGVLRLVPGERLHEAPGAGTRDGPDVLDHLLPRHADAVVGHRHGALLGVEADRDPELAVALREGIVGEGREAQPVRRIRGVGDELAEKDLLVAVEGTHHEVEELTDLGLVPSGLALGFAAHFSHSLAPATGPGWFSPDLGAEPHSFNLFTNEAPDETAGVPGTPRSRKAVLSRSPCSRNAPRPDRPTGAIRSFHARCRSSP